MKKMLIGIVAVVAFSSCSEVAGWFSNNDSTQVYNDNSAHAAYARDVSITAANAYSDLFLDSNAVEQYISSNKLADSSAQMMRNFYRVRNYQYAWFNSNGATEQARGLWSLHAGSDSLNRQDSAALGSRMDSLLQSDSIRVAANDSGFIRTELSLTQQLIQYASSHPEHINRNNIYYMVPAKKMEALAYADSILNRQDSAMYAGNTLYNQLKQQLQKYYQAARNGGWGSIPSGEMKKGANSPNVASLKKRLAATGHYAASDTSTVYSDSLVAAVQAFQQQHGLKPTGAVDDSLLSVLNIPAEERVEQILVNMNRTLWMPVKEDTASTRIEVNIPAQMLYVYNDSGRLMEMPVIVGKEGDGTVMFSSEINKVVFNPSWNIPESFVREEILPKMKSDATYLKKNNIEVVSQHDSIPVLKQLPGKDNPLGEVKFLFPNAHNIYLHDTPNKDLFVKNDRALSHGCIRVANAAELAAFLLKNESGWSEQKIHEAMKGDKEQTIELRNTYPVSITYLTSFVDEKGALSFRPDVYGHDKEARERMFI